MNMNVIDSMSIKSLIVLLESIDEELETTNANEWTKGSIDELQAMRDRVEMSIDEHLKRMRREAIQDMKENSLHMDSIAHERTHARTRTREEQ